MVRVFVLMLMLFVSVPNLYASQSTIKDSEGYACMGEDKSKKQTEQSAMADAKRKAIEQVSTYIKSETHVKDFALEKDLTSAYANATVEVIQEIEKGWYKDPALGDCYKIRIKAEVVPDEKAMKKVSQETIDDPSAPLTVKVWTDKKEYRAGEKIKVYIKGNKPFYAVVVYKDVADKPVQILPNPYRQDNYFNGGVVYEIPSGNDRYELEVSPPFGEESIAVYTSTSQLGEINLKAEGGIYQVKTKSKDIGMKIRSVKVKEVTEGNAQQASEFFEGKAVVKTGR
ncbi:MAG: DUF4384 domain-containing protein [Thermodesulfovibrionales bacterium]